MCTATWYRLLSAWGRGNTGRRCRVRSSSGKGAYAPCGDKIMRFSETTYFPPKIKETRADTGRDKFRETICKDDDDSSRSRPSDFVRLCPTCSPLLLYPRSLQKPSNKGIKKQIRLKENGRSRRMKGEELAAVR